MFAAILKPKVPSPVMLLKVTVGVLVSPLVTATDALVPVASSDIALEVKLTSEALV